MIDIGTAILAINPNAEFRYTEDNINTIEWLDGTTPISKSDLEKKVVIAERKYNDLGSSMEMKFKSEMRKQQEHFSSQISK